MYHILYKWKITCYTQYCLNLVPIYYYMAGADLKRGSCPPLSSGIHCILYCVVYLHCFGDSVFRDILFKIAPSPHRKCSGYVPVI